MLKNYCVVSIFFRMTENLHVDERRFEILTTAFVSRFMNFYVIKFESKLFCDILVANSLNY